MIPFSVLDLSPITEGSDAAQSFRNTLDLAQHTERLGFKRYWLAEHHGMPGIASAATAVLIGHVAGGTSTIRVGAGGIMLPNHSPLVIAEQFGTLESLYPGRIDLGLGRAPGSDQVTARALRRSDSTRPTIARSGLVPGLPTLDGTDSHLFFGWYQGFRNHDERDATDCKGAINLLTPKKINHLPKAHQVHPRFRLTPTTLGHGHQCFG